MPKHAPRSTITPRRKATPTSTINPLHMEDLSPPRFEDLVRQLVHGFRSWRMIEPTGRLGSDEGIDIRAEELTAAAPERVHDGEEDGEAEEGWVDDVREWRIQCKRYKRLHPKAVVSIVDDLVPDAKSAPHGVLIAAATDVSAEALSAFHSRALALGVREHHFWSRSVIEDMLYRPENDHLLFAYFGISLQARRRSLTTTLRSGIALKKQLHAMLETKESDSHGDTYLLLRDPSDTRYPRPPGKGEPPARWILAQHHTLRPPGRLSVVVHAHPAWLTPDRLGWDALFSDDLIAWSGEAKLRGLHAWGVSDDSVSAHRPNNDFWLEYVPEQDKAWLKVAKDVPLERVLAVDPIGDGYFPIPHLFVDFQANDGPFQGSFAWLEFGGGRPIQDIGLRPDKSNRVRLFPVPLPADLYPAPDGLDHGRYPAGTALSPDTEPRFAALLDQAVAKRGAAVEARAAHVAHADEEYEGPRARFAAWRETVGLPTFSAAAGRLRAAGEQARVFVRSSGPTSGSYASESLELRFRVLLGGNFNRDYRQQAHVRVSWSAHRGLTLELAPTAETQGRSQYVPQQSTKLVLDALTQGRLEQEIVMTLERVLTRG